MGVRLFQGRTVNSSPKKKAPNENKYTRKLRDFKKRCWYSGEHSCLPSSWPGFDSRTSQNSFCLCAKGYWKKVSHKSSRLCMWFRVLWPISYTYELRHLDAARAVTRIWVCLAILIFVDVHRMLKSRFQDLAAQEILKTHCPIDNQKKEVSTKLWYSTIGHLATRWLYPFSGVARACVYAHMIFTAVSKRDAAS